MQGTMEKTVLCPSSESRLCLANEPEPAARSPVIIIPDCLEHVFKYLKPTDKGRAARVCRMWRDTCYRRSVWRGVVAKVRLSRISEDVLHSIHARGIQKVRVKEHKSNLELVTRVFRTLRSLDIGGCHYTSDETIQKAFASELSTVTDLDLSFCASITDLGLSNALVKCPALESLCLQGCTAIRLTDASKTALRGCSELHSLSLAGCKQLSLQSFGGVFCKDSFSNLKHLDLRDCLRICDGCLRHISNYLHSLESLNLSFCISITDEGLVAIAKGLPRLRTLKLRSIDTISSCSIAQIASRCTSLCHLDIGFCEWVDDDCLEELASGLIVDSLEELDLSCARVTDQGILKISEAMYQLKHLKIGQCLRLTDQSLAYVGQSLRNLVTIDFYGCRFSGRAINRIWDTLPNLLLANNFMISNFRRH